MPSIPLVTLTTDFGLADPFVGVMKGVIAGIAPEARVIDLTHDVPPQDVAHAARVLADNAAFFPPGTIHLAVVDPGVGSGRRPLCLAAKGQFFVGPDNGIFSAFLPPDQAVTIAPGRLGPRPLSRTFHGRDLFAPAAARIALGDDIMELGEPTADLASIELSRATREGDLFRARVIAADRFGNLMTDLSISEVPPGRPLVIRVRGREILGLAEYYALGAPGEPIALVNSTGRLEIAVAHGSAAETLGAGPGTEVLVYLK
jgi:hypothetical protein